MHRDEKNNSASQNFTCLIIVFRALCEQEKERKTDNSNNAFSDKQHNLMMDWHEIGWCLYERGIFELHSYITYLFVYGLSLWFSAKKANSKNLWYVYFEKCFFLSYLEVNPLGKIPTLMLD